MKNLSMISWLLIAFTLLALSACSGGGTAATPTSDTASVFTQIASTALALQTQTVLAAPVETNTPENSPTPEATNTPLLTDTPLAGTPSSTPLALKTAKPTSQAACDNMAYVADVTVPDGYTATPGEVLDKTWNIKNLGPCSWSTKYVLIFGYGGQGTDWNTVKAVNLSKAVLPGETIDVTISLKAPTASGEYGGYFRLQNDKGFNFGDTLSIYIKVK